VFDHVTIRASDREASERFYSLVLAPLGIAQTYTGEELVEWDDFSISPVAPGKPVTRRLHIGFVAPTHELVDAFHRAGVEAGYRDDGAPGPRTQYRDDYYGAFLLDPDGNSAEAVCHGDLRRGGNVDHLWVRVADVDASARFYGTIAPVLVFQTRRHTPEHAQVVGPTGSFSLVAGPPTEDAHIAFPVADDATVAAFHRAGIEAGYRDNGGPGERPEYHQGYYGAFLLDPDGNNIEAVNHNR
jgi:catechol 2,3-dioxygenase-like lactoylglutathione lyase family enzyme